MFDNLCDVPGVLVGHATDEAGLTGCTAVVFETPAVVGVDVRGSSPETRGTAGLHPTGILAQRHALLLTGGSAFGLAAADGVSRYLEERGVGLDVGVARVPLISSAVIFDLAVGDPGARPGSAMGFEAASNARGGDFAQGSVGAGTGASVGKALGMERAMKGASGSASVRLASGLVVAALAAANAFGGVTDPGGGTVLAGPRMDDGTPGDTVMLLEGARPRWGENTTLAVVATNARLSKPRVTKVAEMAHDGLARVLEPVHASVDGDVIFAASVGEAEAATDVVGAWGARMISEAVLRAVRSATGTPDLPAVSDP